MRWLVALLSILSIAGVAHAQSAANPTPIPAGSLRTLQSFGAVGNGVTDDTKNVQTALNSGAPLSCNGKFLLTSLVTITNVNVYLQGSSEGCMFILNNFQTMIYAALTVGSIYNDNHLTMKDVKFSINGTHSPANVHIVDGYADFAGVGVWAPQQTANGWQGIRVQPFDCVFCAYIVDLAGSLDGLSDDVDVTSAEGAFVQGGIRVVNAIHVTMHQN
jgi:hypothetical protein